MRRSHRLPHSLTLARTFGLFQSASPLATIRDCSRVSLASCSLAGGRCRDGAQPRCFPRSLHRTTRELSTENVSARSLAKHFRSRSASLDFWSHSSGAAGRKVALVIGNATNERVPCLSDPGSDLGVSCSRPPSGSLWPAYLSGLSPRVQRMMPPSRGSTECTASPQAQNSAQMVWQDSGKLCLPLPGHVMPWNTTSVGAGSGQLKTGC